MLEEIHVAGHVLAHSRSHGSCPGAECVPPSGLATGAGGAERKSREAPGAQLEKLAINIYPLVN